MVSVLIAFGIVVGLFILMLAVIGFLTTIGYTCRSCSKHWNVWFYGLRNTIRCPGCKTVHEN